MVSWPGGGLGGCVSMPLVVLYMDASCLAFWLAAGAAAEGCCDDLTTATLRSRGLPFSVPTATATLSPFGSVTHLIGPLGIVSRPLSLCGEVHWSTLCRSGSMLGSSPNLYFNLPPYCSGMFSGSMYLESVGYISCLERIKILDFWCVSVSSISSMIIQDLQQ